MQGDAFGVLVLDDIGADHLTPDVVWAIGDRRSKDRAGHGIEDITLGSFGIVGIDIRPVVVNGLPLGKICGVATLELSCAAEDLGCWAERLTSLLNVDVGFEWTYEQ